MTETNIVFNSGTDRLNRSQMEVPPGVLERSTLYYWAVSYRDCHGAWSKYSLVTGFTTASLPQQPENVSPADGATGVSINPTLRSSAFAGTWSGDTHMASQWQISENPGDYASPVFDQTTQTVNLTAITIPTDLLSNQTTYFWRVRHQGSCGESWSEFSEETSFFVNRSAPQKPVNQSPTDGEDGTDLRALLVSSPFVDTDIGDSQQAAQWRVTATAGDYTSPVFDSGADITKLTEMKVPSGDLEPEQTYYWQVRHQDSYGTWSEWSGETGFTTAESPSVPAALVVAAAVVAVMVVGGLTASMIAPL
jgi:hypothetical protein